MIIGGLNIAFGIIIATFAAWVATNPDLLADAINDSLMMRTKDVSKGERNSDKAVIAKQLTNSFQPWLTLESSCFCIKSLESSLLCVLFMALEQ